VKALRINICRIVVILNKKADLSSDRGGSLIERIEISTPNQANYFCFFCFAFAVVVVVCFPVDWFVSQISIHLLQQPTAWKNCFPHTGSKE
jgi:hypothetical protein